MADEKQYDNQGKSARWISAMRGLRGDLSTEMDSIIRDLDFTPTSEDNERDQRARIIRSLEGVQRMIDSFINRSL